MTRLRIGTTLLIALALWPMAAGAQTVTPDVATAISDVNAVLQISPTGQEWAQFLRLEELKQQMARGEHADPAIVAGVLARFAGAGGAAERAEFVRMRKALEQWLAGTASISRDQLAEAIAAAQGAFVPPTESDRQAARAAVQGAADRFDAWLQPSDPNAAGWRSFLMWDAFRQQIAAPQPDLAVLRQVYERLSSGNSGLELVWFHDVRETLRRYLTISEAMSDPNIRESYRQVLAALPERLSAYETSRSAADAAAVSALLDWLVTLNQASWIVRAVRQPYGHPNLYVEVSDGLIAAGMVEAVDDVRPVRDCILGTSIFGNGHTTGLIDVELTPSPMVAQINTVFRGTLNTNTVGYNGPARIYSTGTTSLVTYKPIYIDAERIWSGPATTGARTRTNIHNIRADRLPFIVERIAWQRAREQKPQAERIAAQHAQDQVSQRADEQAVEELEEANRNYQEKFRRPLLDRGLFPSALGFSTSSEMLYAVGLQGRPVELAAATQAPRAMPGADLAIRVHESAVNNAVARILGGMVLDEVRARDEAERLLGEVPESLQPQEGEQPWSILLAEQSPISVEFDNNQFSVTLRGRRYTRGGDSYPGMNVTAVYQLYRTEQGPRAVREGELQIYPPGFTPGGGRRLSVRQQVLRDLIQRRFQKVFPAEIIPDPVELPKEWKSAGPLNLVQWKTAEGWLVMSWQRASAAATVTTVSAPVHQP